MNISPLPTFARLLPLALLAIVAPTPALAVPAPEECPITAEFEPEYEVRERVVPPDPPQPGSTEDATYLKQNCAWVGRPISGGFERRYAFTADPNEFIVGDGGPVDVLLTNSGPIDWPECFGFDVPCVEFGSRVLLKEEEADGTLSDEEFTFFFARPFWTLTQKEDQLCVTEGATSCEYVLTYLFGSNGSIDGVQNFQLAIRHDQQAMLAIGNSLNTFGYIGLSFEPPKRPAVVDGDYSISGSVQDPSDIVLVGNEFAFKVGTILTSNVRLSNSGNGPLLNPHIDIEPDPSLFRQLSGPTPPFPSVLERRSNFLVQYQFEAIGAGRYDGDTTITGSSIKGEAFQRVIPGEDVLIVDRVGVEVSVPQTKYKAGENFVATVTVRSVESNPVTVSFVDPLLQSSSADVLSIDPIASPGSFELTASDRVRTFQVPVLAKNGGVANLTSTIDVEIPGEGVSQKSDTKQITVDPLNVVITPDPRLLNLDDFEENEIPTVDIAVEVSNGGTQTVPNVFAPNQLSIFVANGDIDGGSDMVYQSGPKENGTPLLDLALGNFAPGASRTLIYTYAVGSVGKNDIKALFSYENAGGGTSTVSGEGGFTSIDQVIRLAASTSHMVTNSNGSSVEVDLVSEGDRLEGEIHPGDSIVYEGTGWNESGGPIVVTLDGEEVNTFAANDAFVGVFPLPQFPVEIFGSEKQCAQELVATQDGLERTLLIVGELAARAVLAENATHADGTAVAVNDAVCSGADPEIPANGDSLLLLVSAFEEVLSNERTPDWIGLWIATQQGSTRLVAPGGVFTKNLIVYNGGPRSFPLPGVALLNFFESGSQSNGLANASFDTANSPALPTPQIIGGSIEFINEPGTLVQMEIPLTFLDGSQPPATGEACAISIPGQPSGSVPALEVGGSINLKQGVSGPGFVSASGAIWFQGNSDIQPCPVSGLPSLSINTKTIVINFAPTFTISSASINPGSSVLEVASNDGFAAGDQIVIGPGDENRDPATVAALGSLILAEPLQNAHPAGTLIVNVSAPPLDIPIPPDDDSDQDGVVNWEDNCVDVANPALGSGGQPSRLVFQTTTGGQLDDDADGFGNQCDAKFTGGQFVGGQDLTQVIVSFNKDRSGTNCGLTQNQPCAKFDLDNSGQFIGATDLVRTYQLFNTKAGPKCDDCPRACIGPSCP